ncbi:histidine phosphatase family protein [Quadrisphaera sp. DSM 44207]|uniref:histidine phosphatase family protein n=1 Tax=Quadrisphaera sp. DSM 44207 TaxID=1881057 RepID=UPI0008875ACC|nr:histidine phosphatase family protein [Quadrisphaera sp. DSM 44207]SDQ15965.1 Broad specificity phosphatase PhoE [Quadrisphaera sp. DSM 44207]
MPLTAVHLLRHGEVRNPAGVLYGRLAGYGLSDLGVQMAQRVADVLVERGCDVAEVIASPLQRAQETARPVAAAFGLPVGCDERLIEAANHFEGLTFGVGDGALHHPRHWWVLRNPFRPSWGEPYAVQAERVLAAARESAARAAGRESVLVAHQLPIWVARRRAEGRRLWHDPRRRECTLASLTTLRFDGTALVGVEYSEPARALLPGADQVAGA